MSAATFVRTFVFCPLTDGTDDTAEGSSQGGGDFGFTLMRSCRYFLH